MVFLWGEAAERSRDNTEAFVADVAERVAGRIQLSTDSWGAYLTGVRKAFDFGRVDYGQISKTYASVIEPGVTKYSPPVCIGCVRQRKVGRPDPDLISTSYVESLNMTTRQNCRRLPGSRMPTAKRRRITPMPSP